MNDWAIEANQLIKKFPRRATPADKTSGANGDEPQPAVPAPKRSRWPFGRKNGTGRVVHRRRWRESANSARRSLRPAGTERRRQIDDHPHVVHPARTDQRHGPRQWLTMS